MRRFFSDDSFWNTPIAPGAQADPRSDHFINILGGKHGGPFHTNLHKWTIPVYEAALDTPRHTVIERPIDAARMKRAENRWGRWSDRKLWWRHGPGFGKSVPIPDHARPDPEEDAHLAIVDWSTQTAWDMWGCRRREDGQWESNTGMVYSLAGTGVWKTSDFANVTNGDSIHFHGPSRAAGVPAIAGLIMFDEVQEGRIRHKIAAASYHNALQEFVSPAAWTDGFEPGGIPEGAVLQLDPSLDANAFDLSPAGKVVFRAMQEYGMVVVDVALGNAIYGEYLDGHPSKTWRGILAENELGRIPLKHYRVLKLGQITRMGDGPRGSIPG
jgi:hypothetical protein